MATAVGWLLVRTSKSHGIHSTSPNSPWMTRNLLKVGHPTCMIPQVKHTDYPDQCVYLYIYIQIHAIYSFLFHWQWKNVFFKIYIFYSNKILHWWKFWAMYSESLIWFMKYTLHLQNWQYHIYVFEIHL